MVSGSEWSYIFVSISYSIFLLVQGKIEGNQRKERNTEEIGVKNKDKCTD